MIDSCPREEQWGDYPEITPTVLQACLHLLSVSVLKLTDKKQLLFVLLVCT